MLNVTAFTMFLQMQSISISKTVLSKRSLENYLVALILEKNKQHSQYDLLDNTGISPRCNDQDELLIKHISVEDYHTLVRSLNEKRQFFFFIMSYIR